MDNETLRKMEHDFTLMLSGVDGRDDEVADALFAAGCDDATFSLQHGIYRLDFSREGSSLKRAIISAIKDVRRNKLGVDVHRVDSCSLVTQAEIARKLNMTRASVSNYIAGKRLGGGFPAPVCSIGEQSLWAWCEVACWLRRNEQISEQELDDARDVELINWVLSYANTYRNNPARFDETLDELAGSVADGSCDVAYV